MFGIEYLFLHCEKRERARTEPKSSGRIVLTWGQNSDLCKIWAKMLDSQVAGLESNYNFFGEDVILHTGVDTFPE